MKIRPAAMMLFIELTPYILGLDEEIQRQWPAAVSSFYIARSVSQPWARTEGDDGCTVLPERHLAAIWLLWKHLRKSRPGLVLVAGWAHPVVIAVMIIARLLGTKVVCSSDTWISSAGPVRRAAKRALLKLPHSFCPGGSRQARYLETLGVSPDSIFPANMTVDVDRLRDFRARRGDEERQRVRASLGVGEDNPLFLFVGRLEPVKGPDILLEAFSMLPREHPARLVIVGAGLMRPMVEEASERDPRIIYRGRLESDSLWAHYCASDVLVAPSRSDAWGLAINEALAFGLPVILSDCFGCLDDLVPDGRTGMIVRSNDPAALVGAIANMAENAERRKRYTAEARTIIAGWTTKNWAANIIHAWDHALQHGACADE